MIDPRNAELETIAREWRLSVDALEEELCLLDGENRVVRCNRAMQERLGKRFVEIVGQPCHNVVCGAGPCSTECPLVQVRAARRRITAEVPMGERLYRLSADPVLDRAGAVTATVLLMCDVTDPRRSAMLSRMLTDSIPSSVLLLDENLRVILANGNFLQKSRRSAAQTIGQPLHSVFPEVILSGLGLENQIRQAFAEKRARERQRLTYRAPGVPIRVYFYSIIPVALGSRVDHILLVMDDITEQTRLSEEIRRMERHLASVVESASDLVVSMDSSGCIITWNRAAEHISGYCAEEVRSRPLLDFLDGNVRKGDLFARGALPNAAEWDLLTKSGKRRPVSWVISRMPDDQGRTTGYVAVGRDLAERRKFEQELLQSQKLAALGVMAGGIAHEIRTPLTISSSAAQFLMDADLTPAFRMECAQKVHDGIHRASVIIENLLRFARPAGNTERGPLDVVPVIREAVAVIGSQARMQNIRVESRLPEEPVIVLGVAALLEQVFVNLLLNAIHAMPDGGAAEISVERNAGEVVFRVADTGHGIPPEDLDKIFDPFYTRAPAGKGTGLGLSLCYSIIKEHVGSIRVESELGKGSVAIVALPLL